jgi:LuxR family maltose regulon positive regulatory protein
MSTVTSPRGASASRRPDQALRALAPFDAKLRVAEVRPGLVARPALVDQLCAGPPVALISGSVGSGKTTLLAQWAAADERPFAWLTITESDNDLAVLTAYLARALDSVNPLAPEALAGLSVRGADGTTVLLPRLGRALFESARPMVLVLDDVHLLTAPKCQSALAVLVAHLPPGSQLGLASRGDLWVPRARLRAQRDLIEIGPEQLALGPEEGAELVRLAGLNLDDESAASLVERTEGWAAGLYLAALALRDHPEPTQAASGFSGDDRVVADYLRHELLAMFPESLVQFLSRTSILDELSGPLCDAVLESSGSQATLEELERSNLFVVPLDRTGDQFRYHHLFGELLRHREPDLQQVLHGRASRWYEDNGDIDEAVRHARFARDIDRAAALIWRAAPSYLGAGRDLTVSRWLETFSLDEMAAHPPLAVAAAWCCVVAQRNEPIGQWVEMARRGDHDAPLPDGTPLGSAIALLDALMAEHGLARSVEAAARSYALDIAGSPFRSVACSTEGTGLRLLGALEQARARLEDGLKCSAFVPGAISLCHAELALISIDQGNWSDAERSVERALELMERNELSERPAQAIVLATSALALAHRGASADARSAANRTRRLLSMLTYGMPWMGIEARLVLARAELILGNVEAARMLVTESEELLRRFPDAGTLADEQEKIAKAIHAASGEVGRGVVPLTSAELRVLRYLPTHLSFQAIAEELFVSRNTVKTQAIAIYRKLGVSSRGDAVSYATELGLLEQ